MVGFIGAGGKECGIGTFPAEVETSISVSERDDSGINGSKASLSLSSELSSGIGTSAGDERILSLR